jgi:Leucine rich repeat
MRGSFFLWLCLLAELNLPSWVNCLVACPPGCYCVERKSDLVPDGLGVRINCHPLSSGPLNFSLLPSNTIQLDLAKYGLKSLRSVAFESSPYLQKLDLQNNEISQIEDRAFDNLQHLELVLMLRKLFSSSLTSTQNKLVS